MEEEEEEEEEEEHEKTRVRGDEGVGAEEESSLNTSEWSYFVIFRQILSVTLWS